MSCAVNALQRSAKWSAALHCLRATQGDAAIFAALQACQAPNSSRKREKGGKRGTFKSRGALPFLACTLVSYYKYTLIYYVI